MAKERRDLPSLRAYAKTRTAVDPIPRGLWKSGFGALGLLGFASLAVWATYSFVSAWLVPFAFFIGLGIAGGIIGSLDHMIRTPRTERERFDLQIHGLVKMIANMGSQRIKTNIDPVAGQILEACAMQRERVVGALTSPAWEARSSVEPWRGVREQSLIAAESAMEEALILCSPFVGPGRGSNREEEWGKVVSDFLEVGVGAAIRRVDKILAPRKPLDISKVPSQLRPAFDVATKMQALADEVDAAGEAANASTPSVAASNLDQALQNLRAVQQAEQELDATTQVQQRLQ